MLVTDISINQYRYCPVSARHIANVCMTLKNQIITMYCQLDLPEDEHKAKSAAAFVGEAIRQLGRMPEYRSGAKTLVIADDVVTTLPMHFA
ncbi:MAG: hypothetical protein JKY94_14335 [Rhodobacteraceae bacterium]|nr:hypothetical protein [Paracoccaceae bacterium]